MPHGVAVVFAVFTSAVAATTFRLSGRSYPDRRGLFLRGLCSALVAAAMAEFLLIVCEVLQAGDSTVRAHLWRCVTAVLLALLVFIVPAVQITRYLVVKHPRLKFMALPVYIVYLLLFRLASTQLPIERYEAKAPVDLAGTRWFLMRQDALACVSFIGITTMAFLCGISSISAPYSAFFSDKTPVTVVDCDRLRESLESITEMISVKELDISRMRLDIARSNTAAVGGGSGSSMSMGGSSAAAAAAAAIASATTTTNKGAASRPASRPGSRPASSASSGASTPKRMGSAFSLTRLVAGIVKSADNRQAQLRSLLVEHDALVSLRAEVEADFANAVEKLQRQQYHKTLKGKIHRAVFAVFALYCIYRVANTYIRMCWWFFTNQPLDNPRGGPRDALVLLIAATIEQILPDLEIGIAGWARIIGVLMSGAVFLAALNGVLQMSLRIMRRLRKTPPPSSAASSAAAAAGAASMQGPLALDAPLSSRPRDYSLPLDLLVVAQVVGVYILSIATTLRFNLPRSMSGPIMTALISPLKITSVQLWNDMVLGLTSTIMIPVLVATNRLAADTSYDEEKGEMC